MKITEKLYIDRLEKMIKLYKKEPCDHCPMASYYDGHKEILYDNEELKGTSKEDAIGCGICRELTGRYALDGGALDDCPCDCFAGERKRGKDEGYMVKVAWNVIRGWKKDNKEKADEGIKKTII